MVTFMTMAAIGSTIRAASGHPPIKVKEESGDKRRHGNGLYKPGENIGGDVLDVLYIPVDDGVKVACPSLGEKPIGSLRMCSPNLIRRSVSRSKPTR
jgi:hypothetical protein